MSTKWIIFFCIELFVGLGDAIVSNKEIFHGMSVKDRKLFFGTDDGSVPEIQLVKLPKKSRSKRSSNDLNVPFEYHGVRTVATLHFVPDHDLISKTSTGIWLAQTDNGSHHDVFYTPRPDIFDNVGPFFFFQNENECSAITEFWRSSRDVVMIGVLKQDYTARSPPPGYENEFTYINVTHSIRRRSADTTSDQDGDFPVYLVIFESPKLPLEHFRRPIRNSSFAGHELHRGQSSAQLPPFNPPNVVYPKLLICPDYSVVSAEKSVEDFLMFFIAHANAIDMMYRQLRDPNVRLKISGIIIPQDAGATPYIARDTQNAPFFIAVDVLRAAKAFFKDEVNRLRADTYSALLILTKKPLYDYEGNAGGIIQIAGLAMFGTCCHWGRGMLYYSRGFSGVMTMAHELGHVFNATHDGTNCSIDGRYAMGSYVEDGRILKWSACTRRSFQKFFKSRKAECTHSQPPVFLSTESSMPGSWMSIEGQCDNDGKNTTGACFDSFVTCEKFGCNKGICYWRNQPPLEGTPSDDGRRCVNQKWVKP